jgi:hypothetical protein
MSKKIKPIVQEIVHNTDSRPLRNRILIGTPTLGNVRIEWAIARFGQVIPPNWSAASTAVPIPQQFAVGYLVADAQNIIVNTAVTQDYEWVLLNEDDTLLPPDATLRFNEYMKKGDIPIISGLYYQKANPTEPLIYRGRGNSCFDRFKAGDLVWADALPTGCLLINCSILKLMWKESPEYKTGIGPVVRKVFETPARVWTDPESGNPTSACGTSDIFFFDRILKEKVLQRSGWTEISKKKYPFLCDTNIFCRHISSNGITYPLGV